MQKDDQTRIRHMLDASEEALSFVAGKNRQELESNRMLALSLLKSIEIVGEAASKVSHKTRSEHPQIPWAEIVSTRNRLVHGYFEIDYDRVWDTLQSDLPDLVRGLRKIFPEE